MEEEKQFLLSSSTVSDPHAPPLLAVLIGEFVPFLTSSSFRLVTLGFYFKTGLFRGVREVDVKNRLAVQKHENTSFNTIVSHG